MYPLTAKFKKHKLSTTILSLILTILLTSCSSVNDGEPEDITPNPDTVETIPQKDADTTQTDESTSEPLPETTEPEQTTAIPETTAPDTTAPETTAATLNIESIAAEIPETSAPKRRAENLPDGDKLSHTEAASQKIAFLTFDDGPDKKNNERILEILEEYGVKATFFTVGQQIERYPEGLKATFDAGHSIGCHSYDHDYAKVKADVVSEIEDWENAAEKALGESVPTYLFRFPGGSPTKDENQLKDKVAELGYNGYDWNCLNNDCLIKKCPADMDTVEWMKQSFVDTFKYGSSLKHSPLIILMHETYSETADMLAWAIEYLQEAGYTFATLDQLSDSWYY
ncbi:MAG: polysaccharide deacetylase family protein [Clostridiales bacterium]|nr:polysaccharide deacetylase family protein [Clostridiales bacterium]